MRAHLNRSAPTICAALCCLLFSGPAALGDEPKLSINGYENAFPFYNLSIGLTVFMMLWVICMVTGYLLYRRVIKTQAA